MRPATDFVAAQKLILWVDFCAPHERPFGTQSAPRGPHPHLFL